MLHFLCSCSYFFTFLQSSQFYWHIRLKSTANVAYFFWPTLYIASKFNARLMFRFNAACFFIYVSFRAVVSASWAFLPSRGSSALYCFYCIVSVLTNKIFIHSFKMLQYRQRKAASLLSPNEYCWEYRLRVVWSPPPKCPFLRGNPGPRVYYKHGGDGRGC